MSRPAVAEAKDDAKSTAAPLPREMESNLLARLQTDNITDPLAAKTVQIAANMEPVILHDDQAAAAKKSWQISRRRPGKSRTS